MKEESTQNTKAIKLIRGKHRHYYVEIAPNYIIKLIPARTRELVATAVKTMMTGAPAQTGIGLTVDCVRRINFRTLITRWDLWTVKYGN